MRIVAGTNDGVMVCFEAVDIQYSPEKETAYCRVPGVDFSWQIRNLPEDTYDSMVVKLATDGFAFASKTTEIVAVAVPNKKDPLGEAEALL